MIEILTVEFEIIFNSILLRLDSRTLTLNTLVDSESHRLLASPEDETLRLASCVIRHILYFGAPQDSVDLTTVVEFRDAKVRMAAFTPVLKRKIVAIDDGGLCLRKELNGGFSLCKNHLAILEGKRQFQCLENGRPIISDNCLAQMTCEALVASIADPFNELQPIGYNSHFFQNQDNSHTSNMT